ncbi:MAG TPA: RDD family protein [Rhizomicrobium sp.]|nr:RDD family protein [Rhizomicrobium sp.]
MTLQSYLAQLADAMPRMMPEREQIVADVRAHIEEDMQRGEALDAVLARFGDPANLAASYLSEIPLVSASFWRRAVAMAIDLAIPGVIAVPLAVLAATSGHVSRDAMLLEPAVIGVIAVTAGFVAYILVGDSRFGQTLGKHWLNLLVVRESGARISVGQAIVRLLPCVLHIWWIDVIFALFTERRQRAFELLSKTRVVTIDPALRRQSEDRPSASLAGDRAAQTQ